MRLRYTLEGAAELDTVLTYIEQKSPQGGRNVQHRIQDLTQLLLQYPHIGKPTSDRRLRRRGADSRRHLRIAPAKIVFSMRLDAAWALGKAPDSRA